MLVLLLHVMRRPPHHVLLLLLLLPGTCRGSALMTLLPCSRSSLGPLRPHKPKVGLTHHTTSSLPLVGVLLLPLWVHDTTPRS